MSGVRARAVLWWATPLAVLCLAGAALWRGAGQAPSPLLSRPSRGPVLVIAASGSSTPFGRYLAEVLAADGWPGVAVAESSTVTAADVAEAHVVVLAEGAEPPGALALLGPWVAEGGVLVTMRPDQSLAPLTGVSGGGDLQGAPDLELMLPDDPEGASHRVIQLHGPRRRFQVMPDTEVRAWSAASGELRAPLVTVRTHGRGAVSAWAFDLGLSLAVMRQGNPAWADTERDGLPGIRPMDAHHGLVDLDRIDVPAADVLLRYCRGLVRELLAPRVMPRLWPLPEGQASVLVVTSDAHGSTSGAIERGLRAVEQRGGHASLYYMPRTRAGGAVRGVARDLWRTARDWMAPRTETEGRTPGAAEVAAWRQRGHEFSLHPDNGEGSPGDGLRQAAEAFRREGFEVVPGTLRTHRVAWRGWVESARAQRAAGMRMSLDTYQVGPALRRPDGAWAHGFLTGSGFPWPFVETTGTVLDCYQLPTQIVDEQLLAGAYDGFEGLDAPGAIAVSSKVIRAAARWHTPATLQYHTDFLEEAHAMRPTVMAWLEATLDDARALDMTVLSAADLLRHTTCVASTDVEAWTFDRGAGRTELRVRVPDACRVGIASGAAAERGGRMVVLPGGTHTLRWPVEPLS